VTHLLEALVCIRADLEELGQRWALVGGLAVSARSEPRTTRDVDLVIAVESDRQAEKLIWELRGRGYSIIDHLEQDYVDHLATVRLGLPGQEEGGAVVDLLFASSGLEPEIVESAELLEVLPGLAVPVATLGYLLALKVLAGRPQDITDIQALLAQATAADIQHAREALLLISRRGFDRQKDLLAEFAKLLAEAEPDFSSRG
jgi:Nucleotidyl transferase AbiEii toxin, Type IV TA system